MPVTKHQIMNILRDYCEGLEKAPKTGSKSKPKVKRKRASTFEALDSKFGADALADYLMKEINDEARR